MALQQIWSMNLWIIIDLLFISTGLFAILYLLRGIRISAEDPGIRVDTSQILFILPVKDPPPTLATLVKKLGEIAPGSTLAIAYQGRRPKVSGNLKIVLLEGMERPGYRGKIANLVTALESLELSRFSYIVFIDDDIIPNQRWLRSLIASAEKHGVSTGYRVYRPSRLAGILLSIWSIYSLDTMLSPRTRIVWGGSAAFKKEFLDVKKLLEMWRGAVSDDVAYTYYVRNCLKREIGFHPDSLVENIWLGGLREAISFIIRQQRIVYRYGFKLWLLGVVYHGYVWSISLYSIARLAISFETGLLLTLLTGLIFTIYGLRTWFRAMHAYNVVTISGRSIFPIILSPIILIIQLPLLLVSVGDTIYWRGVRYKLPPLEELSGYCL